MTTSMLARVGCCALVFSASSAALWALVVLHPRHGLRDSGGPTSFGFSITQANWSLMSTELSYCKEQHFAYIGTLFAVVYLYKQAFAIPGSLLLNIAAGALFGMWSGLILCCLLTCVGASVAYLLSDTFGKMFLPHYFGDRILSLQKTLKSSGRKMFWFLVFARIFPISPGWLLNIAAPILEIPFYSFLASTFVGLAPYNFIGVHTGSILVSLRSFEDILQAPVLLQLFFISILPLMVALFVHTKSGMHSRSNSCDESSVDAKKSNIMLLDV